MYCKQKQDEFAQIMINEDFLIYHFVMSDNNSKIPPSSLSSPAQRIRLILPLILTIVGLICACIILFNLLTVTYTNLFDVTLISNCKSTGSQYLSQIYAIEKLLFSLDVICIILFGFGVVFGVLGVCRMCRKDEEQQKWENKIIFIVRSLVNYLLILASGCLFGNCVKTIVSLGQVSGCASNKDILYNFYTNFQTLSLISGICLLMALLIFAFSPKLWRQQGNLYKQSSSEGVSSHKSRRGLMYKINDGRNEQLVDQNSYGLLISVPENKTEILEQKTSKDFRLPIKQKQVHEPRIFGKSFLTESRYGLSGRKHTESHPSSSQESKKNQHTMQDLSKLKGKQNVRLPLNLELNLDSQTHHKDLQSHHSQNKRRTPIDLESHLINLTEEGPPVQMGHYSFSKN